MVINEIMSPLRCTMGIDTPSEFGITEDMLVQLRHRLKVCLYSSEIYMFTAYVPMAIYLLILYLTNFDLGLYWKSALIGWLSVNFWIVFVIGAMTVSSLNFNFICFALKLKIDNYLKIYEPSKKQKLIRVQQIRLILNHNHRIFKTIVSIYNRYYSVYLLIAHGSYVLIASLIAYIAFIYKFESLFLRLAFPMIFVQFWSQMAFICISAASVNNAVSS